MQGHLPFVQFEMDIIRSVEKKLISVHLHVPKRTKVG